MDFEGYGFNSGKRLIGQKIETIHASVTCLLTQARADLPLFLLAHSMGGLILNTYLGMNPKIADRLAGVIYSAPLFGVPEYMGFTNFKKKIVQMLAPHVDDFVITMARPMHRVCRDK